MFRRLYNVTKNVHNCINTIESKNTVNEFSFSKLLYLYSILNYLRLRINYK